MKKKVLIVHHFGGIGGAGVSLIHIIESFKLMSDKYEVEVYCPSNPSDMNNYLSKFDVGITGTCKSVTTFNHYSGNDKSIFSFQSLRNIIDIVNKVGWSDLKSCILEFHPDIVLLNSMTLCWMGKLIRELGVKVICFNRETFASGLLGMRTHFIRKCLKVNFDAIAFISRSDIDATGNINGHTLLITDKVNISDYLRIKNNDYPNDIESTLENKFIITYLGGLSKLKGAHIIIKAFAFLDSDAYRLRILQFNRSKALKTLSECGSIREKMKYITGFDYEARVLRLIDKYNLWNKIDFIPSVIDVEKYIVQSNVIVFPSTEPHQARPIFEAGAAKVPIIITEFPQTSEFAINRLNSLTFRNGNFRELASKIRELEGNEELKKTLIINNFKFTYEHHNIEDLKEELDDMLSKITL